MKKRWISMLLCICMVVSLFPTAAFASEEAEAAEEIIQEVVEEISQDVVEETVQVEAIVQEIVCTCGTDDAAFHAVTCGAYTAPAEPVCFCAEKCAEPNEWCDICGFDYEACGGTDTAVTYEEEPCTHVDADKPKGYCDLCGELLVTAEGTSADGLHWVFREGDGTLTITGEGPMQNYESNNAPWEDFDTKIQSLVISEGVTTIGDYAFHQGEKLASVSLPSTITYIGDHAFYNCDALTSIVLPDSVTTLGARAFASCGNLTSVKLSENLTEIPESAFYPCSKLTSVVIPASVQTIGKQAFRDCKSIATITLNEGLKSIGELAFYNCDVLEAVSIPGSVTVIDKGAFNNCDALASLTLTEGLETIGDGAFKECANLTLTNENLPSTITTLGSYAFLRTGITSVVLPDGLSVIDTHAFQECPNLKHVTLPGNLTKVDDYAFQECTALQSVIFPESITAATIESYVFEDCTSLTSLYISDGIAKIGGYAFRGCTALRDVTILDGLQAPGSNTTYSLGSHAFGECQDLSMILPATLTKVNNYAFSDASISSAHYLGTEEALAKVDFNSDKVLSSKIHACVMADGKAATCTEPGHSSGWMCEKCDFTMGAVETAPLGHKYSNGVCENCGEACVHTGGEATCTHRAKCTVCKESYGERNPDNHVKDTFYYRNKDENVHTVKHSCCEAVYKTEAHTYENGECIFCGADEPARIVITQQPADVMANLGEKFKITVEAEGDGLTYQWYVKESGAKAFKVSSNKTSSYAYTMQTYMHNRQVYCVITDANGNSVQTETATITRPPQALKILQQPQDAQQEIGQKFSIKPTVQGDGLTYQWYYKESYMKDFAVSSNKTSAYAYTMQSYMHNRSVYCVITDQYGNSVTTDAATITRPPVELKILQQPADVYAAKGEKFSIKPEVQGDGLTYQWYYKESYMKDFKPSSNKTSAYAYSMQSYMNNRSVYCVITDKFGNQVQTEAVTIYLEK